MANITRVTLALCAFALAGVSMLAQQGRPNACPSHITECGCTITRSGTYIVDNDLSADQSNAPNCIEISADHANLNLNAFKVTGNGTGKAVWIHNSGNHAVVQGQVVAGQLPSWHLNDEDPCDPDMAQSVINGWDVGIQDDADDAAIGLFKTIGGTVMNPNGNATAGILINAAHGVIVGNLVTCYNGVAGLIARNSSAVTMYNLTTDFNGQSGVWFDNSTGSNLQNASINNNNSYGIWLLKSSNNALANLGTNMNGEIGVLFGCGHVQCSGNEHSDNNRFFIGGSNGNTNAGILIERHGSGNIITATQNSGNPDGKDMVDLNPHCDSNTWYNNLGTSNQSCIH